MEMPVIASHIHQSMEKDLQNNENGLAAKRVKHLLVLLIMKFRQTKDGGKGKAQQH